MLKKIIWVLLGLMPVPTASRAADPIGNGDAVLHLDASGYASIADTQFRGFSYQAGFSLEAIVNIEANTPGGRWPIILGKKKSPPLPDPGFALGLSQGQFNSVGQQVYGVVADGSRQATVSSRLYQGILYTVMTWDAGSKILRLYINGSLEAATTNSAIASLVNSESFTLGGASNYGQTLQRDLHLGRLWNRALGNAEIAAIWTEFSAMGRHRLPAQVDRTALLSEWLMEELYTGLLKDSQGNNHLQLQGSAALWKGYGPLVLQGPPNGALDVSKSVVLRAAGGIDSLGGLAAGPLHYSFDIDESVAFNSPAFKSSGWLASYGIWKPVLKPSTRYYWRVKVRDSAAAPVSSGYAGTNNFVTDAASAWYVRPGVYATFNSQTGVPIPHAGIYGRQDGTSYDNAWNGLFSIKWGNGGVEPGDTLYICGVHCYTASNLNFLASQGLVYISESGYSTDYPIIIRMDFQDDPGVIWGAMRNNINAGGTWSGPDANGVYSSSNLSYSADYWANDSDVLVLNRATASTWVGNPGASFTANGVWYVKPPDGSHPAGRVCASGIGYRFHLGRSQHIRFYRCVFRDGAPLMDTAAWNANLDTQSLLPLASHITFDSCDLRYRSQITLTPGHDYWTIKNSELAYAPYGIYAFLNKRPTGANYLTVQQNYIHDMGTPRFPHEDAHGVGVQGGEGHLIEGNRIEDTGSAIEFWTSSQPMRNHTIRYNFIKNIRVMPITGGGGIVVSGDNAASVVGLRTGFKIYYNIIMNTGLGATRSWQGAGIDSNCKDFIEMENNVLYRTRTGISLCVSDVPARARIVNNLIVDPELNFLRVTGAGTSPSLAIDHNLYFSTGAGSTQTLANLAGQFIVSPEMPRDQHSVVADPMFVSSLPLAWTDFRLQASSKAIRAGVSVGLPTDFVGTPLPQTPDIGAYQFVSSPLQPPPNLQVAPLR